MTVSLPEDPLGVLPEVSEEDLPEDFRKKGSFGSNETTSGRTGLPESSRNTSSGMFPENVLLPETFQKRVLPDDILPRKGPITRTMSKRLQEDWAKDAREGPRVLMSLRVDF